MNSLLWYSYLYWFVLPEELFVSFFLGSDTRLEQRAGNRKYVTGFYRELLAWLQHPCKHLIRINIPVQVRSHNTEANTAEAFLEEGHNPTGVAMATQLAARDIMQGNSILQEATKVRDPVIITDPVEAFGFFGFPPLRIFTRLVSRDQGWVLLL